LPGSPLPQNTTIKLRYRQIDEPGIIEIHWDTITVTFSRPQRALTPWQFIVVYHGDEVVGSAVLDT
jgi:tRNA-specific 2-thiouridylase